MSKLDTVEMEALLQEAQSRGLWLFTPYQGLWFSPQELREQQANGEFRWGVCNWKLMDPADREEELQKEMEAARQELVKFQGRRSRYGR